MFLAADNFYIHMYPRDAYEGFHVRLPIALGMALPSIHAVSAPSLQYLVFTVFTLYLLIAATTPTPYSICELFSGLCMRVPMWLYKQCMYHINHMQCVCHVLLLPALSVSETSEGGYTFSWNVGEGLMFTCSINNATSTACEFTLVV